MSKNKYTQTNKKIVSTQKTAQTNKITKQQDNKSFFDFEKLAKFTPWISIIFFCILAWVMLVVKNSDYLYTVQERSLFSDTEVFFSERMAVVQGFMHWVGCYLTQFFYHPLVGSTILIGIWCITFYAAKRAFGISNRWSFTLLIPLIALLCSVIDLGYWLYYIKLPGYWFTHSLCILVTILAVCLGRLISKFYYAKLAWIILWTIFSYPIVGCYSLLGSLLIALQGGLKYGLLKDCIKWSTAALCIAFTPYVWYNIYTNMRIEDIWTVGFPIFMTEKSMSFLPSLPFVFATASLVLLAIPEFLKDITIFADKKKECIITLSLTGATILAAIFITHKANFDDYNYHAEMRMYRATDEQRWNDVLEEMGKIPDSPTRQMVMLKNIALMNTGELGTKMFKYANTGKMPHTYDSLAVHMVQTAGSMIYYQYGKANFAYRWCVENGVEFKYNVDHLKIMVRCAMLSGETELAMKYINILKTTTFHKEWAKKYEEMILKNTDLSQTPEFKNICRLRAFTNITDGDQGLCEMYILQYFANTMNKDDKLLQEVTLSYSLVQKDIQLFWPRFFLYATLHETEEMPIHYQEAAYLYGHLEKQVDISKMPFDKDKIVNRYTQFERITQAYLGQGKDTKTIGELTKQSFGDTFWWFYYFCSDVKSY
jgi:hypothetical protein